VITLGVHLQCDPQKVDQVLRHIEKLLANLNQTGIEQTKIDQNIATLRQDFNNEQHKAKFILQQMTHAQLYKVDLANILDAEKVYPDTLAKVLDDLLNEFITKGHGQVITVLHP
jgi:predicted Zn-dependent peptidase